MKLFPTVCLFTYLFILELLNTPEYSEIWGKCFSLQILFLERSMFRKNTNASKIISSKTDFPNIFIPKFWSKNFHGKIYISQYYSKIILLNTNFHKFCKEVCLEINYAGKIISSKTVFHKTLLSTKHGWQNVSLLKYFENHTFLFKYFWKTTFIITNFHNFLKKIW